MGVEFGVPVDRISAVLLPDGWHRVVLGSFRVGILSFDPGSGGAGAAGFRFEEMNPSPSQGSGLISGVLSSLLAVREEMPPEPGRRAATADDQVWGPFHRLIKHAHGHPAAPDH